MGILLCHLDPLRDYIFDYKVIYIIHYQPCRLLWSAVGATTRGSLHKWEISAKVHVKQNSFSCNKIDISGCLAIIHYQYYLLYSSFCLYRKMFIEDTPNSPCNMEFKKQVFKSGRNTI